MKHRRTILKVLLLLIAGAALNVAVAWGLAILRLEGTVTTGPPPSPQDIRGFRLWGET